MSGGSWRRSPALHVGLLLATLLTTTVAGAIWEGVDPVGNPADLARGVPFALALVGILLTHELGHYLMCRRHGVDASLPYFIPAPPNIFLLGTFGAFIRIRARFPDRRALFDVGVAGPWAGLVVAVAVYAHGLGLSTVLPTGTRPTMGDSLLSAFLARVVLGVDPAVTVIHPHPLALAGWFGLFVTSINLIPAGQLDGGHALYATIGRRTQAVPALLVGMLVWLGLRGWPGWLVWAALVTIVVSLGHPPTRDDHVALGAPRRLAALATLVVFVLTFVPEPFRLFVE